MANIFRSKEIYKKIHKDDEGNDRIVPIRGLYVVGDFRPPSYINPGILISQIGSNKAKVEDYITVYRDAYSEDQSCANFLSISKVGNVSVVKYTQKHINAYSEDQSCANFLSIKVLDTLNVNKYKRVHEDGYSEDQSCANFLSISTQINLKLKYWYKNHKSNIEPSLRISKVSTVKATVKNLT